MTVVVCVDERGGVLFNRRRVSSDRTVIGDLLSALGETTIYMQEYSVSLFPGATNTRVCEDWLSAGDNDAYFLEMSAPDGMLERAHQVIVYHWNRLYPSDVRFPMDAVRNSFTLQSSVDFAGNSHEKITREVYAR